MKLFQKSFPIALAFSFTIGATLNATTIQHSQPKRTTSVNSYIKHYKDIAVAEMMRSGVPASITLAQGILESQFGNSRLAKTANNHFGIKCGGVWRGSKAYAGAQRPGNCYRSYPDAAQSYRDHTDFLTGNKRYTRLFGLEHSNYKAWAAGLRKAGYATDPNYASRLISLIERYSLNQFDAPFVPTLPNVATPKKSRQGKNQAATALVPANSLEAITLRARLAEKQKETEDKPGGQTGNDGKGRHNDHMEWYGEADIRRYTLRRKSLATAGATVAHIKWETLDFSGQGVEVAAQVVAELGLVA